jgi:hypothetical protein
LGSHKVKIGEESALQHREWQHNDNKEMPMGAVRMHNGVPVVFGSIRRG